MWTSYKPINVNPPIVNTKYQVGDELWFSPTFKYRITKAFEHKYNLLPINIIDGKDVPDHESEIACFHSIIDNDPYLSPYKFINAVKEEPKCECGAAKLGYTKPGRQHYGWCSFYKE